MLMRKNYYHLRDVMYENNDKSIMIFKVIFILNNINFNLFRHVFPKQFVISLLKSTTRNVILITTLTNTMCYDISTIHTL